MKYRMAFCMAIALLPGLAVAQGNAPLKLSARIPLANVNGRMDHIAIDVNGQRLFATAYDNNTLEVIDLRTNKQVSTIKDLSNPQGGFYDAATKRLFVACGGDGAKANQD